MSSSTWSAAGLSQQDLMIKDQCILLDQNDKVIGHANKEISHIFSKEQSYGKLHRAFSVFLFNNEGKLLLQQRASDKITFPSVWTNTCCSHPLSGQSPSEEDDEAAVANGTVPGVKAAAVRKLLHELGVDASEVPITKFKFLTRLHYWAADVVTHGPNSPWGEHEIDYILFIQADVKLSLNKEEVEATKYVTLSELQAQMKPDSGMLWSPWFRIIVEKFLIHWWNDLNITLTTNEFTDYKTIYRFDPTVEHMGGAGGAGAFLGVTNYDPKNSIIGDQGSKQGSYGKVKIHKHSKVSQLSHIDEIFAALWFKYGAVMPNKVNTKDPDTKFCDDMLGKVSRSFAAVIRQLPKGLCLDIMIFYLALRALDTIEDDMEAFPGENGKKVKLQHLNEFYKTALVTEGWSMDGVGKGDEMVLLQQYGKCVTVFKGLSAESQVVIADITKRMGEVRS